MARVCGLDAVSGALSPAYEKLFYFLFRIVQYKATDKCGVARLGNILQFFFRQIISTQLRAHILNRFPQFPGQIRQGHIAFQQQGLDYFRHSHTRPHPLRAKIVYQIIDNCKNKSNMLTQHLKTILTISIF